MTAPLVDREMGDSAARATGAIVTPEQACRCASFGYCARGDDGGEKVCRHCLLRIDRAYDPCPIFGFGCGPGCDCCTPEQQTAQERATAERATAEKPHYDTGVVAPCDRCGESDVLVVTERDYMDEATEMACRACVEGWNDD